MAKHRCKAERKLRQRITGAQSEMAGLFYCSKSAHSRAYINKSFP
nr:MAG TPA: hypothetical protein [Caudoviricetes sp.]